MSTCPTKEASAFTVSPASMVVSPLTPSVPDISTLSSKKASEFTYNVLSNVVTPDTSNVLFRLTPS